jgi:O-antigen biosynthesis protein WbqP
MDNKRISDIAITTISVIIICVPMLIIAFFVKISSKGPVLHWSRRVGLNNRVFQMPKFRTMRIDTPYVATHLLENPLKYLTIFGRFLRKFSLDEFPQLWSVFKGDMSLVGPRPALCNQADLIELRTQKSIHKLVPGITGWAQVNGRDHLTISQKVEYDEFYMKNKSFIFDLKILCMTLFKVIRSDGVRH